MAKVAIKNMNIISFGGIYHILDVFSKLGFEKLTESVLGKRGSSGKAFRYGSIFCGYHISPLVWVGDFMLRKEPRNTEAPHINIQSPKKTSQHIKFSYKKKYCGIKDIRVLFYSFIFQMIIVFPFIVLKYFSFCCHSSHSILFWNPLVYSCFILIVKSDSNSIQNSSCELSILFNLFGIRLWLQPFFFPIPCLYSYYFSCYFVFVSFCLFPFCLSFFCLYVILSILCHSVSFHVFVALPLPLFLPSFWLYFYSFTCLFFDIFA